jgi:hypothetical protein
MELFYSGSKSQLIGYGDAGYLSNPHKGRSQTSYLFVYRDIVISCRCIKKILVATSSNHSEIITIHKKIRECIWLRLIIQHIKKWIDNH